MSTYTKLHSGFGRMILGKRGGEGGGLEISLKGGGIKEGGII